MRIKHPGQVPYGAMYNIARPDLGFVGFGTTFDMLDTNCRAWRIANGWPIGLGFADELGNQICLLYPDECELVDSDIPLKRKLTMGDVVHGTKVLLSLKLSGGQLLPKETAQARYNVCLQCPLNMTFPIPCNGICPELKTVIDAIIGNEHLQNEDRRSCAVCGCFSAAQVWLSYEHLVKGLDEQMKVSFQKAHQLFKCWKVPGAE